MTRRLISAGAALASCLALAPTAGATIWSRPSVLQPNVNVFGSELAVSGGRTIAAWEGNTGVWAAISNPSRGFSEQRLTGAHIANVTTQLLATNTRGDAVIAWETRALPSLEDHRLPPGELFVSYRRAGERFGPPHRIARGTEGAVIAIDGRGDVTIVWDRAGTSHRPEALYEMRRDRRGQDDQPHRIVAARVVSFELATDTAGDARLVWEQGQLATPALMCSAARPGSRFGDPVTLVGSRQGAGPFDAQIESSGELAIGWEGPYDGADSGMPYAGVNVADIGPRCTVDEPPQHLLDPVGGQLAEDGVRVVANDRGDAAVVWDAYAPGTSINPRIVIARRSGAGPFGAGYIVGTGDVAGGFDAAIAPTGSLVVTWESNYRIDAAMADGASAPLRRRRTVSVRGQAAADPVAAITAGGRGRVLWQGLGPDHPKPGGSDASPLLYSTSH